MLLAAPAVSTASTQDGSATAAPEAPITLWVDASDTARKIYWVSEILRAPPPGPMILQYPQWESASHGPTIPVAALAGLVIQADGRVIPWRRDRIDPYAFHLETPPGTEALSVTFQIITSANEGLLQRDFVSISWQRLVLYPAGRAAQEIAVSARLRLPDDLRPVSSLALQPVEAGVYAAAPLRLDILLDSPVQAAPVVETLEIGRVGHAPVNLNLLAGGPDQVAVGPDQISALGRLIDQAHAVFGSPPFDRYEILARLQPDGSTGGTEHRSSSEISLPANYFSEWDAQLNGRDIIPHELVHAWNGIYRRPEGQIAATPNAPLSGELLWIYEGQTEFWGRVLAARSGLRTPQETRDQIALDAAAVAGATGRKWKSLDDDVNYPAFMLGRSVPWRDWQRRRDYYQEGVLLWLDVESALRERSAGHVGVDDVARRMFGDAPDASTVAPYAIDDLIEVLDTMVPGDWGAWLTDRVAGHGEIDPLAGLEALGWRLVFSDTPTETDRQNAAENGVTDLTWSIGLTVDAAGRLRSVAWEGPAFNAEMAPGHRLLEVNGAPYSAAALIDAVRQADDRPVVLTVEQDGETVTRTLSYQGTLRYPRLERLEDRPDQLADLLVAR